MVFCYNIIVDAAANRLHCLRVCVCVVCVYERKRERERERERE